MTWVTWPLGLHLVAGATTVAVYVALEGGKPSIQEMVTVLLQGGKDCAGCHGGAGVGGEREKGAGRSRGVILTQLTPDELKGRPRRYDVAFIEHLLYAASAQGT